jgi:hypothetical protein
MEQHTFAHLSAQEKKDMFASVTITHRQLEAVHDRIGRAIRQPAGFCSVLVHGPTGVGKTRMMESLADQAKNLFLPSGAHVPLLSPIARKLVPVSIPVLLIEVNPPDGQTFNRGHFYRTILNLLGEQTYPKQMHVDIHAEATSPKRRRLSRAAVESNDDPDLRDATEAAMHRHGVRVIFVDEAHHMMYGRDGTGGSTLQEQLEWLKSLGNKAGALFILMGTYDLFNFGKLSGQTARRCLPVHFPRYRLEREEDCVEFQTSLLELLRRVPLECSAERWVTDHWLYFYECSVGCIGILKEWLLRAVCTALDDGLTRLSLDCVQDHALPVDIYRQMTLDAYEGEQRLNLTEVNREHVWRLLQGGELIAPVPPLPPRETPPSHVEETKPAPAAETLPADVSPTPSAEVSPPIKKSRGRKKTEAPAGEKETGSASQTEEVKTPAKRGRKKKTAEETSMLAPMEAAPTDSINALQASTDAPAQIVAAKPKRTRRVGEPKPTRYPVGEPESERGA